MKRQVFTIAVSGVVIPSHTFLLRFHSRMSWQTYTATSQKTEFRKHCDFHCLSSHCKNIVSYLFASCFSFTTTVISGPRQNRQHRCDWWNLEYYRSARLLCAQYSTLRGHFVYSEFRRRTELFPAVPLHRCCLTLHVDLFSGR
jgi:hypothetical protein